MAVVAGALLVASGCAADPPSSVVGVVVDACDPGIGTGSGMVVDKGLILTSAHVVAGANTITVVRTGGASEPATIVAFDPEMDIAYLAVDPDATVTLEVASRHVEAGDRGVAYVWRDGRPVTLPVTVLRPVTINTEDIYVQGETKRPGFELTADIRTGDSGGAVVVDGKVVGVLWARNKNRESRAYAIDIDRGGTLTRQQLRTGDLGAVDLTRC